MFNKKVLTKKRVLSVVACKLKCIATFVKLRCLKRISYKVDIIKSLSGLHGGYDTIDFGNSADYWYDIDDRFRKKPRYRG